jgi:hypothetical protein
MKRTTKKILLIVGILVLVFFCFCVLMLVVQMFAGKSLTKEERLGKEIKAATKKLPIVLDSLTRLDSITYLPKDTLVYNYTITGVANGNVDIEQFDSLMLPMLIKELKEEKMKRFREFQMLIIYRYLYEDGERVSDIIITPNQYN